MELPELSPETMEDLRRQVEIDIASGFYDLDEVVERTVDSLFDEAEPEQLEPVAERLAREALARHLRAQAAWPAVTDCDRLDHAFAELERAGIVARQHFSCCMRCGTSEIGAEMGDAAESGLEVRGYTFYHAQDTERAVDGGSLCLAYGAAEEGEEPTLAVAREIVATLQRHGLATQWNGSAELRIEVEMDWKRRWPFDHAA